MLQVLISPCERYSMPEQAQMAVEAGAKWISVDWHDVDPMEIRAIGADIAAVCRENNVILVFEGQADAARELGVHGVLAPNGADAVALRQQWGAEPILGAFIADADQANELATKDIDYGVFDARDIIGIPTALPTVLPVVCRGDYDAGQCAEIVAAGFSGILTGKKFFDKDEPAEYIRRVLETL